MCILHGYCIFSTIKNIYVYIKTNFYIFTSLMCRIVRIWFEMDLVIDVNLTLKPVLKLGIGH